MPKESYAIAVGIAIAILVLLIAAAFIIILITYSNNRKRKFLHEQESMRSMFKEQLLQSKIEIQEETFNGISKEIHDNVGQILSLAKVQLSIVEKTHFSTNHEVLGDLKESISMAMVDLRDIAKSLSSDRIKLNSLSEITNHELQRISRLGTCQVVFCTEGKEQAIEEQNKLITFRIIQESLQNILKHAKAQKIEISFHFQTDCLICQIKDDGVGFAIQQFDTVDGSGLLNMSNRAKLIGGQLSIQSEFEKGTLLTLTIPYGQ